MPTIPVIQAQENLSTPLNRNRAQTVQTQAVRANPGMYDAQAAAGTRLGGAIAGALDPTTDLAVRVKQATDSAFITRAETSMQVAHSDFENWTKTNPDPTTWDAELSSRIGETKEGIMEGAKALSPRAQLMLNATVDHWETSTKSQTQIQATEQSLNIANASFTDAINAATTNNDIAAVKQTVDKGVALGVFHPKQGELMLKRATAQVNANVANAMIETDPFNTEKKLAEKDEAGNHAAFPNMNATQRETLVFRAHKAAVETRANTQKEWASQVADAQAGNSAMPDREAIDAEAAHQGISPKWVANLFKPPQSTDPHEFAKAYTAVSGYDASTDPTHEKLGELISQVETFKGPAKTKLDELLTAKTKSDDALNKASVKAGEASIRDMLKIGGYGKFHETISDVNAPSGFRTVENPASKANAEVIAGSAMDKLHQWAKDNPEKAKSETEVMKFVRSIGQDHATNNASRLIINSGAFGLPPK